MSDETAREGLEALIRRGEITEGMMRCGELVSFERTVDLIGDLVAALRGGVAPQPQEKKGDTRVDSFPSDRTQGSTAEPQPGKQGWVKLLAALRGMVGLIQLLPDEQRRPLLDNHRYVTAYALVSQLEQAWVEVAAKAEEACGDPDISAGKLARFPFGMNADDHAETCQIRTSRDGWDAECSCGVLPASGLVVPPPPQEE